MRCALKKTEYIYNFSLILLLIHIFFIINLNYASASDFNDQEIFQDVPGGFSIQKMDIGPSDFTETNTHKATKQAQATIQPKHKEKNSTLKTTKPLKITKAARKIKTENQNHRIIKQLNKPVPKINPKVANTENEPLNLKDYTESPKTTKKSQPTEVATPSVLNLFTSLMVVLVLIFISAWLYNKIRGIDTSSLLTGKPQRKDKFKFNLLTSLTLGQGKNIHIVEVNGKKLVIGSTANNINLLTEIDNLSKSDTPDLDISKYQDIAEDLKQKQEEGFDFSSPESYELGYADIYKEYISKENKEENENP